MPIFDIISDHVVFMRIRATRVEMTDRGRD